MKKIIFVALTALMMVGCSNQDDIAKLVEKKEIFSTIEYDSCEYLIRIGFFSCGYLAHKGNCRFCEERD